jgi:hypothetical protein
MRKQPMPRRPSRAPRLALAFLACVPPALAAQDQIRTVRVTFDRGASSKVIEGSIKGRETIDYLVNAKQGQTMNVSLATKHGATYFNIIAPHETDVSYFNSSTSGNQFEGAVPASGDQKIRVYMMRSAGRRSEKANYRLEMIVTGAPHGAGGGDALVPGTDFHAKAQIPCVAEPNEPMRQCDAGVKRTANGGTVHVTTLDGGSRVITYRDGKVFSTDADSPFEVERRDDWTIVRIGTVEVYEIPDALVFGG